MTEQRTERGRVPVQFQRKHSLEVEKFKFQVAGHGQILQFDHDDRYIYKPFADREYTFYAKLPVPMRRFCPCFFGCEEQTALLEEMKVMSSSVKNNQKNQQLPPSNQQQHPHSSNHCTNNNNNNNDSLPVAKVGASSSTSSGHVYLKLENLVHGYGYPCVLDVKIGTRLYCEGCTDAKREKMIKKSKQTTSSTLGFRVCGMQFFDYYEHQKTKKLKQKRNGESGEGKSGEEIVFYQGLASVKYGRERCLEFKENNIKEGFEMFFPCIQRRIRCVSGEEEEEEEEEEGDEEQKEGEEDEALREICILSYYIKRIKEMKEWVSEKQRDIGMFSSSLLLVYDAHPKKKQEGDLKGCGDTEGDDNASMGDSSLCADVRMIDFAQSQHLPGFGRDDGYVFGLENLLQTLEGIKESATRAVGAAKVDAEEDAKKKKT